jgi:glycerol uptake facilitator-like aquaporin
VNAAVARRLAAEFTGTGLLVAVVVGSGIAATRLTTDGARVAALTEELAGDREDT